MKIVTRTRRLDTPQTTTGGRIRKNIEGEPVYTEYLNLTNDQRQDVMQHMSRYIDIISSFSDQEFAYLGEVIDFDQKTQIDNEPTAYNFLQRLQFVVKRIDKGTDDLTMGIVDQYNHVVSRVLRVMEFPQHELEAARITIEDPDFRRMRNQLNPALFKLGDE